MQGFFVRKKNIPALWQQSFHQVDFQKYAYEIILTNEFTDREFMCVSSDLLAVVLASFLQETQQAAALREKMFSHTTTTRTFRSKSGHYTSWSSMQLLRRPFIWCLRSRRPENADTWEWEHYSKITGKIKVVSNNICVKPSNLANRTWASLKHEDFKCETEHLVKTANGTEFGTPGNANDPIMTPLISTVVILLGVIVAVIVWVKIRDHHPVGITNEEMKAWRKGNPVNDEPGNDSLKNIESLPYNKIYEIHRSRFSWDPTHILGKGNFGIVFKGKSIDKTIAIKTVQSSSTNTDFTVYMRSLLSEIKVMCYLDYEDNSTNNRRIGKSNIISLIGACTNDFAKGIFLLTEFCELGSLDYYLRKNRENFYSNPPKEESSITSQHGNFLSPANLTKWAFEIANGMSYIASRNIIHGDLASRNVLLTNQRVAKVSDFGLSRRLYEYSTYSKKRKEPLPWRWMAIESLRDMTFSTKSDVWSYGVTLWEIFSLAEVPYSGLSWTFEFVDSLESGLRPTRPKYAKENLYNLMEQTWLKEPSERLDFDQLRINMQIRLEEYNVQDYECIVNSDAIVL